MTKNLDKFTEYYDELYPFSESQAEFIKSLVQNSCEAPKYLRIGCGTGLLESKLAREGFDVTGIDVIKEFLHSATIRYKLPDMAIRFFQMSYTEMGNFLGKNFYDVIACINDRAIFFENSDNFLSFLCDSYNMLKDDGALIIQTTNFEKPFGKKFTFPVRENIRVSLYTQIIKERNEYLYSQTLQNSQKISYDMVKNKKVLIVTINLVKKLSKKAGFSSVELFQDFKKNPFSANSERIVYVIKK